MSAAGAVSKLSKPQLRGLLNSYLKKHLTLAVLCSVAGAAAWHFGVSQPRKKAYAEFYKTYDAEKDYIRMKKAGVVPQHPELNFPPKISQY